MFNAIQNPLKKHFFEEPKKLLEILELNLPKIDPLFNLKIVNKKDWVYDKSFYYVCDIENHTVYLLESIYKKALNHSFAANFIIENMIIVYLFNLIISGKYRRTL